jgi:GT2 family glycosyltransferase
MPDSGSMADTGITRGKVTIVVLSHNRPELLEKALQSIAEQTCDGCEVLVIDNASPLSPRIRDIVHRFKDVQLIANVTNRGFTGGMNQGLAQANGEFVYLTEDDIELERECVATLVDYLRADSAVALAGPVMWNRGRPTIRCAGGSFTLGPVYQLHVTAAGDTQLAHTQPFETMYIPGAMIAARTATLRELEGFRSDFFMYGEDVELCARVRERGWRMAIVPRARVFHHEPLNQPESPAIRFHKQKNLAALYMLHAPWRVLPEFFARYFIIDGSRRLFRNRETLPTWCAAWLFALARSPAFLFQRLRRTCATS